MNNRNINKISASKQSILPDSLEFGIDKAVDVLIEHNYCYIRPEAKQNTN